MTKEKKNSISLKAIGEAIKTERTKEILKISEIEKSSQLSYNTITKLEKGGDINLSSFLKICFALDVHPKDLLDIEMDAVLPGAPAKKKDEGRPTPRINELIENNYFKNWRSTSEVVEILNENHPIKLKSNNISTILNRLHKSGRLKKRKNDAGLNQFMKA